MLALRVGDTLDLKHGPAEKTVGAQFWARACLFHVTDFLGLYFYNGLKMRNEKKIYKNGRQIFFF